jgi:galactokinase/galacturonokinase
MPGVDPTAIRVVKAPLRICPLGAHIDHQLGPVTGMTIDQSVLLAFAPSANGAVHVASANFAGSQSFDLAAVPPYQPRDWGNYLRGAALALQRQHRLERGLVGVIGGDMPVGGLSSSAAVTIAYLLALQTVNGLDIAPREAINLVRYTENDYIGLNNGILDQSAILFSQAGCLTLIDPDTLDIEQIPTSLRPEQFEILIIYSGVSQGLVGTGYNNRVAECVEAAGLLLEYGDNHAVHPNPRLRRVPPALFAAYGQRLPDNLRRRAAHYFDESRRVQQGVQAWRDGNLARFGALMNESGQSSIKNYECGSPQLITLYDILRDTPGVYGTRFSGAGFRGNCLALIDPAARQSIGQAVHRRYPAAHPAEAAAYSLHVCHPDGRAQVIAWQSQ